MKNDDDFLTTSAAARILARSESAVRRASDLGLLPVQRTSNGTRLFRRRDVHEYLAHRDLAHPRTPEEAA